MFISIMQHRLTPSQRDAAWELLEKTREFQCEVGVKELENKELLTVPADPELSAEWFLNQSELIEKELDGFKRGDLVLIHGQLQLVNAIVALVYERGATPLEACTERKAIEEMQGEKVVKRAVFEFVGYRVIYLFQPEPEDLGWNKDDKPFSQTF